MRKMPSFLTRLALASALVAAGAAAAHANSITVPNGASGQCGTGNPVNVNSQRFAGNCGSLVTIAAADTTATYVQDNSPSNEGATPGSGYRVRFYVNTRLLDLGTGDAFDVFEAYDGADPAAGATSGNPAIRIEILENGASDLLEANRFVKFYVRTNGGGEVSTPARVIRRGFTSIEFSWVRDTAAGATGNGTFDWWFDGIHQTGAQQLTGIDNDLEVINYARWGAVSGIDATTHGSFRLDDYASQRTGYIGPASPFGDVAAGTSQWGAIQAVYGAGIMPEKTVGSFDPNGDLFRKEIVKTALLARFGTGYVPPACPQGLTQFADVPCPGFDPTYVDFIYDAAKKGITSGCGGGNFCPDGPTGKVTRGAMAVFLLQARGIGSSHPCPPATFADVASGPFCPFVNEIAFQGITGGCGGGNFCPNNFVLRGEMAVFLAQNFAGFGIATPQVGP
jgi:S-layer family protein